MLKLLKASIVSTALFAGMVNASPQPPADCASSQQLAADAARKAVTTQATDDARLQSAVFAKDDAGLTTSLAALVARNDQTAHQSLRQALAAAAWTGNIPALSALLSSGVDPNATTPMTGAPPIVLAASCGKVSALEALVAAKANVQAGSAPDRVDNVPRGALEASIAGAHPEATTWLLDHGYEVCRTGEKARVSALLARPGMGSTLPASVKSRLMCQVASKQ